MPAGGVVLATPCGALSIGGWPVADVGRATLVLAAQDAAGPPGMQVVESLYRHGDEGERAAVLRALALFDPGELGKPLALEAGRANSKVLLASLMLGNPYPAARYSDSEFNQLVLKALFIGFPLAGIVGLGARANAELSRMCEDYYDERIAADRAAPADIWLALAPHASPRGEALLSEHLAHADPRHRYYAIHAAARLASARPTLAEQLRARLTAESDPDCMTALQRALHS